MSFISNMVGKNSLPYGTDQIATWFLAPGATGSLIGQTAVLYLFLASNPTVALLTKTVTIQSATSFSVQFAKADSVALGNLGELYSYVACTQNIGTEDELVRGVFEIGPIRPLP